MTKYKFKENPHLGRKIVLDTETTGLSPRTGHKIVEIAAMEMIDGKLTGNNFHKYINPKRSVPQEAIDVHGLTTAFLKDKPTFEEIAPEFLAYVGDPSTPVLAHNSSFDARFVNAEISQAGHDTELTFECTLKLARAVLGKGQRTLSVLSGMADVAFSGRGAHSALADTEVLAKVLQKLIWPREAKIAIDPTLAPVKPAPKAKAKSKATAAAAPKKQVIIPFPEGFKPLSADEDQRICRYDDHDINHLITSRGKRWTNEEVNQLVSSFVKEQKPVMEIVKEHGRTPAALFLKLEAVGAVAAGHPYTRLHS